MGKKEKVLINQPDKHNGPILAKLFYKLLIMNVGGVFVR